MMMREKNYRLSQEYEYVNRLAENVKRKLENKREESKTWYRIWLEIETCLLYTSRLWPLPECFPDGRGTGRLAGQLSYCMGTVHRKAVRVHGFYRQAVSEPCRHHPALGR